MLNHGYIQGYVSKTPEIDYSAKNGRPMAKFNIACERDFKPGGHIKYDFIQFVAFGRMAEIVMQTLEKDQTVFVEYEINADEFLTADGRKRYKSFNKVNFVRFDRLRDPHNANVSRRDKDFSEESETYEGFSEEGFIGRTPKEPQE